MERLSLRVYLVVLLFLISFMSTIQRAQAFVYHGKELDQYMVINNGEFSKNEDFVFVRGPRRALMVGTTRPCMQKGLCLLRGARRALLMGGNNKPYKSHRLSPGGPDPQHHSMDPS